MEDFGPLPGAQTLSSVVSCGSGGGQKSAVMYIVLYIYIIHLYSEYLKICTMLSLGLCRHNWVWLFIYQVLFFVSIVADRLHDIANRIEQISLLDLRNIDPTRLGWIEVLAFVWHIWSTRNVWNWWMPLTWLWPLWQQEMWLPKLQKVSKGIQRP